MMVWTHRFKEIRFLDLSQQVHLLLRRQLGEAAGWKHGFRFDL
jgi:hypothetical protein